MGSATKIPDVDLASIPKIAATDLRLLWVNDWYDGPLEAIVELRGEQCLMILHDEDPTADKPYRWLVIRLSDAQRADELNWHGLFVQYVGDHWCFHGTAVAHPVAPSAEPDPEKFYGPYRERPALDVSANVVLGWSDEMPAQ